MRMIDTKAYNKRLHSEISELEKLIKNINPENLNQLDGSLVKTAESYVGLISNSTWADNANFNGIEMHKIKQLLKHLRLKDRKMLVRNFIVSNNEEIESSFAETKFLHTIDIEDGYDGRASFVVARVMGCKNTTTDYIYFYPFQEGSISSASSSFKNIIRKTDKKIIIDIVIDKATWPTEYKHYLQVFYILWR